MHSCRWTLGLSRIECSAPIFSAMMLAAICGLRFEIPVRESEHTYLLVVKVYNQSRLLFVSVD